MPRFGLLQLILIHTFRRPLKQQFGSAFETFYAPALPLGDDFTGLVYLHGAAAKNAEQCVLTDEDFGRAYIIRGWATRFLEAMFRQLCGAFRRL